LFLKEFVPTDEEEILKPSLFDSSLSLDKFLEDYDGIAKLMLPIKNASAAKTTIYSMNYTLNISETILGPLIIKPV